jgi:protein-disulfide isomerase
MEPEPAPATATPTPTVPSPTPAPSPTASALAEETSTPAPSESPAATAAPTTTSPSSAAPTGTLTFTYGRPGAEPMHIRGDPSAPVVLEEFGDFECRPCSLVWAILQKLEPEFDKQLVVVFREHPLKMHHFAFDAARAAEAAGLQGRFWEMHDALYRNRDTWTTAAFVRQYLNDYARDLELDVDRFKQDCESPAVAARIVADQDRGDSLGVDRTPILYVNGEKVLATDLNEKGIRTIIEKAIAAKSR